ncbi:phosphotransferase family protein [Reyranella sp. CPCC 100927]|uniref:phosphotransferase family protein n=1 Tax=Reyranella sp. CPCC 100927 TaxID=2599616 RepID=UPI0011B8461C|nr:phosphotransferase [Reyranella sp. CPCC 100927]TWT14104.1 phosphotransferase [Reyranella sp. CPCC 100927]
MRQQWTRATVAASLGLDEATALVRPLPGAPRVSSITALSGGLANTNLRLDFAEGHPAVVLRLYQRDPAQAAKERSVHALAARHGLPVPRLWFGADDNPVTGSPYAVVDWVDGQMLDSVAPTLHGQQAHILGVSVGAALARIHSVTFATSGFFDGALAVATPIDVGGAGLRAFLRHCLIDGPGGDRLGADLARALLAFVDAEAGLLDSWAGPPCLTHADFGGSNILVRPATEGWALAAVLDWEFTFSGSPFFDLGNLLRPPLGRLPGFAAAVAAGYDSVGRVLPPRWREMAALADLTAWADFLARDNPPAGVIDSARERVRDTIARRF